MKPLLPLFVVFVAAGCGGGTPAPEATPEIPLAQLPAVDVNAVLEHTKVLSSDEYEGRAPGTKGEGLSVAYIVEQFKTIGLKPGNTDGTFVQQVPLVGITPDPKMALTLRKGSTTRTLKYKDDFVAWTKHVADTASLDASELVFVGYGVVAPEFGWDDYKGLDVKGKTLVMLVNDPPVPDPTDPSKLDPKMFGGRAMTYYGRWTYKHEIAASKGAAGALIIHETGPAGYPFSVVQGMTGERFDLVTADKNLGRCEVEGWVSLEEGRQLLSMAGHDFDALKKQAARSDFEPVPLGATASVSIQNTLRTIASQNVVARLEGGDRTLKDEYVVYTAHWDHLGKDIEGVFHGAKDNAVGVAGMIEMARAFTRLAVPPKRSILFLAVTAEEQGLLGSQYYAVSPIYPLARTLANINIDTLNINGRTKDIVLIGLGNSDLDDYTDAVAREQGRVVRPDAEPEKGFYYRSDHFNFAKLGVPALDPDEGTEFIGKPPSYGQHVREEWTERDYHKPSDVVRPRWDLSGAAEDLNLFMAVGYRVAQAAKYPEWKPGTEFRAIREAQLRGVKATQ